jgi:4-amino-4-deoxy-L-arabinose transferase-like glycosyltransferase/lipid-A-disaccharide synthase-like uncharacterized protein
MGLALVRRWRRVPSSRIFLAATAIGLGYVVWNSVFGSSERFLTTAVVLLPPVLLLVGVRWLRVCLRRLGGLGMIDRRLVVAVLAVVVLGLCWLIATGSTLWDRDEPRFSRAAVEMLESDDWMVPTFNDKLRPDKPVGIYWLMANSVRVFGVTEFAVRLWAGLGLVTAMLLTASFVRRRLPDADPVLAAGVLGFAPLAFAVATAATTDAVLLASITAAMVVVAAGLLDRWTVGRVVLLGVLLGWGQLVKGPIALAVPGLAVLTWIALSIAARERRWAKDLGAFAAAALIGLGVFLVWALPANAASGGELARLGLGHHVVNRMQQPLESHGGGLLLYLPYYPLVLLIGLAPWTIYLPGSIAAVWRRRLGTPETRRLLLAWALPTVVLMTFVATKLPHYVLPVVPALAAIIALALPAAVRDPEIATGGWWSSGRWIVLVLGLVLAVAMAVGVWWLPLPDLRRHLIGIALVFAVAAVTLFREHRRRDHTAVILTLGLAAVIVVLQVRVLLPVLETVKPAPVIAHAVRTQVPETVPVYAAGFREPSLAFYLGRSFTELGSKQVDGWLDKRSDAVLITEERLLGERAFEVAELARYEGINISNGKPVVVVAVRRGPRPAPVVDTGSTDGELNLRMRIRPLPDGVRRVYLESDGSGGHVYVMQLIGGGTERLRPAEFAARLERDNRNRSLLYKTLNITSPVGIAWVAMGLLGQLLFTGRMLLQWFTSERAKRSVVPVGFWWMSLAGASMLLVYFVWRRDIVGVLGQSTGWVIYIRNLWFIYRGTGGDEGSTDHQPSEGAAGENSSPSSTTPSSRSSDDPVDAGE